MILMNERGKKAIEILRVAAAAREVDAEHFGLFTQAGNGPALSDADIVAPALAAEELFHHTALSPLTAPTIRRLSALEPKTLALMHGSSTQTHCGESLARLADAYDQIITKQ